MPTILATCCRCSANVGDDLRGEFDGPGLAGDVRRGLIG